MVVVGFSRDRMQDIESDLLQDTYVLRIYES